jgi:hypothetical protein
VNDFIKFHKGKYGTQDLMISLPQVITNFDDAKNEEAPVSLKV